MSIKIPEIVGFLILMAILFGLGHLLPITIVLAKAGLLEPDIAEQLNIYSDIMLFGFAMMILYVANYLWKKNDKYGDNIGIFNKDETMFKDFTYVQLTLASLIFFSGLFLLANFFKVLGKGFFGLKVLPQQFEPVDSLIVSTFQIPIAENFMAGFTIGLISLIVLYFAIRYSLSKVEYRTYQYTAVVIGLAIFGYIWHLTAYPGSDVAGFVVAIFWGMGAFLSLVTGFFGVFLIMHMANNFFIDFARLFSSDVVFGAAILIIVSFGALYWFLYKEKLFPLRFK